MAEFKFKIGEIVSIKAARAVSEAAGRMGIMGVLIVERMMQECPGGTQLQYLGSICGQNSYSHDKKWFNEVELEPMPSLPSDDPLEILREAKEGYVVVQDFPKAAAVQQLIDDIMAGKIKDPEPKEAK